MQIVLPRIRILNEEKSAKVFPEIEYKLQFDGCSKSNPGIAGAGAVIYKFNKEINNKIQFVGNNSTNNVAEYTGLIIGLKLAIDMGIKSLVVEGDSMLIIKQMKEELCNDKIDIIITNINHHVKKYEEININVLYEIIINSITIFEINKDIFMKAINRMIKNDYIQLNDNKVKKYIFE